VALATHMLALADGSDMMGSLRNPAGWNGVYGLRPSWGRVPSEPKGDTFLHQLATNGPMARNPADLALLLDVQSGADPRQPHGYDSPLIGAKLATGTRPRLAWLADWGGAYPMEDGVLATCEAALNGWDVDLIAPLFPAADLWEAWTTLRSWGQGLRVADINRATLIRSQWFARAAALFENYDALVLPTAQCFPFPIEWDWPTEIAGAKMDTYHRWMEVVIPASLIGLPALAVPIKGAAMGLQFVGPRGSDARLLEIGQRWEDARQA